MVNIQEIIQVLQNDLRKKGIHYLAQAKRANNNLMVTCPYHKEGRETSPSCGILLSDRGGNKLHKAGTVHCFTCGATHSLEEMISHVYGKYDRGVYGKQWLLENFNILSTEEISFDFELRIDPVKVKEVEYKKYKTYHPYFKSRGLSEKLVDAFDLGYDEATKTVTLPMFDPQGRCIMVTRRALDSHTYINTTGSNKTSSLYGIHMIYRMLNKLIAEPYVFIVEGPFDVMKMWQNGYIAVGIMQAAVSEDQMKLIDRLPFLNIVIATDNDQAGRDVAKKLAKRISKTKQVFMMKYPPGVKDPGEMKPEHYKAMVLEEYRGQTRSF